MRIATCSRRLIARLAYEEDGLGVAELLVAVFVITVGILAFSGTVDVSRGLTNQSELKQTAVHRAQRELDRIQSIGFKKLAHPTGTSFSLTGDPLSSRIVSGSEPGFKWNRNSDGTSEPLATAGTGTVQVGPTAWSDGRFSGSVYRFVTWANDEACAGLILSPLCPNSRNYKRVTVVVTAKGFSDPVKPVWFSALVSDPDDGPLDAVTAPVTECLDDAGNPSECVNKLSDTVKSLFLTDTPATSELRQLISGSHTTHPTIAPIGPCELLGEGCPIPDLLGSDPPPLLPDGTIPNLFKYSTDVSGGYSGGRVLRRDTGCSGTPSSSDNTKGGFWAGPAETAGRTLNGKGGMSIYTHTVDNVSAAVTLCLAVYEVPQSLVNLVTSPPTEIGRASYSLSSWPKQPGRVSFPFRFRTSDYTIPAGSRLGVRIWVADSSGADIAVIYDHPTYPAHVQINEPGS